MSLGTRILLASAIAGGLAVASGSVHAKDSSDGQAVAADSTPGFENPPNADKKARGYVNPCIGNTDFPGHVSRATGYVKNSVDKVSAQVGGEIFDLEYTYTGADAIGVVFPANLTFQVEYVEWHTACAPTANSGNLAFEPGTEQRFWIRRPTQGAVAPGLLAEVVANLGAPDVFWPNVDPEFGWVYVTVANDVRIAPVNPVRRERSVSNLVGSVSVWVEAAPSKIVFESGDYGSRPVECSYASATAPFVIESESYCFYRYENSSSIARVVEDAFVTRTSLTWEISSSHALTVSNPVSWRQETIQVAAVQAIEIAT